VNNHPNASVSLVAGGGLGALIVWALGHAGITLTSVEGGEIASGLATVFLLIGRDGFKGIFQHLWTGSGSTRKRPPAAKP